MIQASYLLALLLGLLWLVTIGAPIAFWRAALSRRSGLFFAHGYRRSTGFLEVAQSRKAGDDADERVGACATARSRLARTTRWPRWRAARSRASSSSACRRSATTAKKSSPILTVALARRRSPAGSKPASRAVFGRRSPPRGSRSFAYALVVGATLGPSSALGCGRIGGRRGRLLLGAVVLFAVDDRRRGRPRLVVDPRRARSGALLHLERRGGRVTGGLGSSPRSRRDRDETAEPRAPRCVSRSSSSIASTRVTPRGREARRAAGSTTSRSRSRAASTRSSARRRTARSRSPRSSAEPGSRPAERSASSAATRIASPRCARGSASSGQSRGCRRSRRSPTRCASRFARGVRRRQRSTRSSIRSDSRPPRAADPIAVARRGAGRSSSRSRSRRRRRCSSRSSSRWRTSRVF